MSRDFHHRPFDEPTKLKLELFSNYIRDWLPVFARVSEYCKVINIFDFFAGPGKDSEGNYGSPLIILRELLKYSNDIKDKNLVVNLILNEKVAYKFNQLKLEIEKFKELPINIIFENLEFLDCYKKHKQLLDVRNSANLLLFDQTGIRHINKEIFLELINYKTTDFLFFISSSILYRFYNLPEIRKFFQLEKDDFSEYSNIHRDVVNLFNSYIPSPKEYYLGSFSIKKGSNIYGIIFGSNNTLGINKFLSIAWKIDPLRGDANFDIDRDKIDLNKPSLFEDQNRSSKLNVYQEELKLLILNKKLRTDKEIYVHSLKSGFLPKHSKEVIIKLIKENKIEKKSYKISSDSMKKEHIPIEIEII